jgi:carbon-monoxide dehydrogenase medium subunit
VYLPDIELHECTTLQEAMALMGRLAPNARLLAGGTDLLVDLKTGRAHYDHVISINRIDALRGISQTDEGLRIGSLTTVTELDRSDLIRRCCPPLLDATRQMANPQVRNAATIGGNIVSAVPCADLPPILMAMNASVALRSAVGERTTRLDTFFVDVRQTALGSDEVLLAVIVPTPPERSGAAYARFALRDGNTIAVAGVAAALTLDSGDRVQDARIVLGAVSPIPKLVESAGDSLVGGPLDEETLARAADQAMQAAEPISDVRGSAEFRREIVGVMTRRALETACERAQEAKP